MTSNQSATAPRNCWRKQGFWAKVALQTAALAIVASLVAVVLKASAATGGGAPEILGRYAMMAAGIPGVLFWAFVVFSSVRTRCWPLFLLMTAPIMADLVTGALASGTGWLTPMDAVLFPHTPSKFTSGFILGSMATFTSQLLLTLLYLTIREALPAYARWICQE